MNELETADIIEWDHLCIVCSKTVDEGGGMCHIKAGKRMIALCCPLCIETFNKDPMHYLRLRTRTSLAPAFAIRTRRSK